MYAAVPWTVRNPPGKPEHCHLAGSGPLSSRSQPACYRANLAQAYMGYGQIASRIVAVDCVADIGLNSIHIQSLSHQLGAAGNFDDLVKFGNHCKIRRSQMFTKLAFELGDVSPNHAVARQ